MSHDANRSESAHHPEGTMGAIMPPAPTSPAASVSPTLPAPTPPNSRSELIDIVRGFALFGVMLANMVWVSQWFALSEAQRAALPTADVDVRRV